MKKLNLTAKYNILEDFINNFNLFDVGASLILIYFMIQCFLKGLINNIKEGSKVNTEIIANNIARPVKIPK